MSGETATTAGMRANGETGRIVRFGSALVEQLRWFWHRLWLWIVIVTTITAVASAWIISSMPDDARALAPLLVGNAFHPMLVLVAISWALSAWRDDPPKDRQYFWLHPVERTSHTIARTLAGFIWLLAVVAVVVAVTIATTQIVFGGAPGIDAPRMWIYSIAGIALAYIASSIAPVLSDRPAIWIVLVVAVVFIGSTIADLRQIEWLQRAFDVLSGGPRSFGTALSAPGYEAARAIMAEMPTADAAQAPEFQRALEAEPATALLIWLPVSIAAFLGATFLSRPR